LHYITPIAPQTVCTRCAWFSPSFS